MEVLKQNLEKEKKVKVELEERIDNLEIDLEKASKKSSNGQQSGDVEGLNQKISQLEKEISSLKKS